MTLIIYREFACDPTIAGVVCDCCQAELRDDIDIHEVVHLRLHAGYGSAWGDGNAVELDLCDACGHRMFAPFARVMPTAEVFRGHVAHGFDPRRIEAVLHASPEILMCPIADELVPSLRASGAWALIGYHTLRYFIPVRVLLSPLFSALRDFLHAIKREEQLLRLRFGRH